LFDEATKTCKPCHHKCVICKDATSYNCEKCIHPYVLKEDECVSCAECEAMDGFFCNKETNTCDPCSPKCQKCTGTADNCIECTPPRAYPPECKCPAGTFDNGGICVGCNYKCATCENREGCIDCIEGRGNPPQGPCPDGTFDGGYGKCIPCPPECKICTGPNYCIICENPDQRSPPNCKCPPGYRDAEDHIACEKLPEVPEIEDLIPVTPYNETAVVEVPIDPRSLSKNYEIGYGFYYRFMWRLPERIELSLSREKWLGIAGLSENGDYGKIENHGDRVLSMFSWPMATNGM
jgi:hypothetical protein